MSVLLGAFVAVALASFSLGLLNLRHQGKHGSQIPEELAGTLDSDRLARISAYTADRARLALTTSLLSSASIALFVFGGWLERYDTWISSLSDSFVWQGVLFFLGLALAETLISLPFSLYATFRIEARHGFNRMTVALFWSDFAKSLLVSAILITLACSGALALMSAAPDTWWIWVWGFFVCLGLLLMYLGPYVIEPLFFKMRPLEAQGLVEEVRTLAERAGVHVGRVLTMDASRRSAHSNAYFTGIGRTKRVVLFDTLLDQLSRREVLSVLSHELGHWQKRHIQKRLLSMYALALGVFFAVFHLTAWPELPQLVGASSASFPARLVILAVAGSVVSFVITPLASFISRRHEWEADRFASELWGAPGDLADALVKLSRENLANLHPHPLYAAFYYSHPPVLERVGKLRRLQHAELG